MPVGGEPGLRSRRREELEVLGVGGGFFVRLRMSNRIIFYIALLSWEFGQFTSDPATLVAKQPCWQTAYDIAEAMATR